MELTTLPSTLAGIYAIVIFASGGTLGVIIGRHIRWRRAMRAPEPPPELLERRITLLEAELDEATAAIRRLTDERDFMRELRRPHDRATSIITNGRAAA